jgi:hypothetical protein
MRCALALAVAAAALSWWALSQFDDSLYRYDGFDIWFHADQPRAVWNMTDRGSSHDRTTVHPLFSILLYPLCKAIMAFGVAPLAAAKTLVALSAASTLALFYLSLRNLGLRVAGAVAFGAALMASSTFIHWFAIVDTYAFTAPLMALMLWVLTRPRPVGAMLWILASAGTLSITITNWSFGLVAAFFRLPWRAFLRVSVAALVLVAVIAVVQKLVFPTAGLFFDPRALAKERHYTQVAGQGGEEGWMPLASLRSMLLFSAVAPVASRDEVVEAGVRKHIVNNQHARLRDEGLSGLIATALWVLMLGLGLRAAFTSPRRDVASALAAFSAGQVALHLVYGQVTFLYAAHFFPAFLALAAFGAAGPAGWIATAAATGFTVIVGYVNIEQFRAASTLANMIAAARGNG